MSPIDQMRCRMFKKELNQFMSNHPRTPVTARELFQVIKKSLGAFALVALLLFSSCSSSKPTTPPVVTHVSPGQTDGDSNFGAQVVVDSTTATATVVSIDAQAQQIVLKRADGRLVRCRVRPGVAAGNVVKVGDEVTIAVGEERALALGKTAIPESAATNSSRIHVQVPNNMVGLAEASETLAFTGKIVSIDNFDRLVLLEMAEGRKVVHPSEVVNLADFKPGDEVSARITEVVVLIVQRPPAR